MLKTAGALGAGLAAMAATGIPSAAEAAGQAPITASNGVTRIEVLYNTVTGEIIAAGPNSSGVPIASTTLDIPQASIFVDLRWEDEFAAVEVDGIEFNGKNGRYLVQNGGLVPNPMASRTWTKRR